MSSSNGKLFPSNGQSHQSDLHNRINGRPLSSLANVKATFPALLGRGFWPVLIYPRGATLPGRDKPAEGKEPVGKGWGLERWTIDKAAETFKRLPGAGIGLTLGPGRGPGGGWLADIEGDGPDAEASRLKLFDGEVLVTMGWGSVRGGHALVALDPGRLEPTLARLSKSEVKGKPGVYHLSELPGLELRLGGRKPDGTVKQVQSVVPPTLGTNGQPREWNGVETVADAPDAFYATLSAIADAREAEAKAKPQSKPQTAGPERKRSTSIRANFPDNSADAWLRAALDQAVSRIESTTEGERRDTYRNEAYCLAGYLWYHDRYGIGYDEATLGATLKAALAHGVSYGDPVVNETVDDGIRDGKAAPRNIQNADVHAVATGTTRPTVEARARAAEAEGDERPDVEVTPDRHEVLGQTVKALARDRGLYYRGNSLVIVSTVKEESERLTAKTELRKARGGAAILPLSDAIIGCYLTRNASFYQMRTDRKGEPRPVDVHPPDWLIRSVSTLKVWPGIRELVAVVESPFPRPDGTIVDSPGYDPATGTYFRPSIPFPAIPDRPTQGDARNAWLRLAEIMEQFPFAGIVDFAVWGSGLLSTIGRPAIAGPVPGHAFIGNKAGTGKGLAIDTIGLAATGRNVPTSTYPIDPVEASKVSLAFARAGKSIIHFDNLEEGSSYGSSSLDSALTSMSVDGRVLGTSENTGDLSVRASWFLSGNNITPTRDAYRRWLPCNLITTEERPEERRDIKIRDLRAHVLEHRGEIVRDALIILRAHAVAGRPVGDWAPLGSFEHWDQVVRGALWFAGAGDCCSTRRKAADESPDRKAKIALLEGWCELPNGMDMGVTTEAACDLVAESPHRCPTLRTAMLAFGRDGKLANHRQVAARIRGLRDNVIEGLRFIENGEEHRSTRWKVVRSDTASPF